MIVAGREVDFGMVQCFVLLAGVDPFMDEFVDAWVSFREGVEC